MRGRSVLTLPAVSMKWRRAVATPKFRFFAVEEEGGVQKVVADILVNLEPDVDVFEIGEVFGDEGAPFCVLPFGLVQFDAFVNVRGAGGRGDEVAPNFQMVADVIEEGGEVGRRDVFHDFPGGDEVELDG